MHQFQSGLFDELFVDSRRHKQEQSNRAAQCKLVICDCAGNDNRISE
jgi:hypothetical protein